MADGRHESHLYVAELNDDLISFKEEPRLIAKPEQGWEINAGADWRWNEGAFVLKHQRKYYLMYSANFYASRSYSVRYAIGERPTGPFYKSALNPVLYSKGAKISGPGHNSVTTSPTAKNYSLFIAFTPSPSIDRMGFREDGTLYVEGPTDTPQNIS